LQTVEVWEDNKTNLKALEKAAHKLGLQFVPHYKKHTEKPCGNRVAARKSDKLPQYVGLFLTPQSKRQILKEFPPTHAQVFADHVTLLYEPTEADIAQLELGSLVKVQVKSLHEDAKGQALSINLPPALARISNRTPHITISTAPGVDPFYSNQMLTKPGLKVQPRQYTAILDGADRSNPVRTRSFPLASQKQADLMPPLGYPGGPCHVVKRIDENVRSPKVEDRLVDLVESGNALSNSDASKVYDNEGERGVWKFKQLKLTAHAQYRMDLRGVTVPEVRLAINNFFRHYNNLKSKQQDRNAQKELQGIEMDMMRKSPLRWTDPKIKLTVVFTADVGRGQLALVTAYWEGQKDPKAPGACRVAATWCRKNL